MLPTSTSTQEVGLTPPTPTQHTKPQLLPLDHGPHDHNGEGLQLSVYRFAVPDDAAVAPRLLPSGLLLYSSKEASPSAIACLDADGDAAVPRRKRPRHMSIQLYHHVATPLATVGLQCWRGALLLSEALLARRTTLADRVVLELGGGVGLASLVAASAGPVRPRRVYLTDKDNAAVLDLARRNVALNRDRCGDRVHVEALEWTSAGDPLLGQLCGPVDVLLAGDVIYDDDLTNKFFHTLRYLLWDETYTRPDAYCLLALEKRVVFSVAHLATVVHGYERFQHHLSPAHTNRPLAATRVPLDTVPACLVGSCSAAEATYRTAEVELWEIRRQRESV